MEKQELVSLERPEMTILTSIPSQLTSGGMVTKEKRMSSWMIQDQIINAQLNSLNYGLTDME